MKKFLTLLFATIILFNLTAKADEGMWILSLLNKNYEDMKKQGFKLTPEDIYSLNKASIKDAIVIFGGGCTGEIVSKNGLLFTNHHCGYGSIQSVLCCLYALTEENNDGEKAKDTTYRTTF